MRILVTGAGGAPSLNFVKSLRKSREDYYILGTDMNPLFLRLNPYLDDSITVPEAGSEKYVDTLNRAIAENRIEFLYAQPDVEVDTISRERDRIKAKTFLPSKKAVSICHDKYECSELLYKEGFGPKTVLKPSESDVEEMLEESKLHAVWVRNGTGSGGSAATPAWSVRHVFTWINLWKKVAPKIDFIIQPCLGVDPEEGNYACQMLYKHGRLITSQSWQRLKYILYPSSPSKVSGTPSVCKTVDRKDINEFCEKVIKAIDPNPNGVYGVDLKEWDGRLWVTEVNPGRFFTPSLMFTMAGLNFPNLYVKTAYGQKIHVEKYNPVHRDFLWIRGIDMEPLGWFI